MLRKSHIFIALSFLALLFGSATSPAYALDMLCAQPEGSALTANEVVTSETAEQTHVVAEMKPAVIPARETHEQKVESGNKEGGAPVIETNAQGDKNSTLGVSATTQASNNVAMTAATPKNGWVTENGKTHYYEKSQIKTGWVVTDNYKNYGLQRYWMGAYGDLVTSKIVNTDFNGYLTYCTT